MNPAEARERLDAVGKALLATAELAVDGRRREIDLIYGQLLYSALMRIRSYAEDSARVRRPPAEVLENIVLICDAALGTDGPPAPRGERHARGDAWPPRRRRGRA